MKINNLRLKFDNGLEVGSWILPDPNGDDSKAFLEKSKDVGWHISYMIAAGAKSCEFIYDK